jgi:hypothetical protein
MRVRAHCAHETLNSTFQGLEGGLFCELLAEISPIERNSEGELVNQE